MNVPTYSGVVSGLFSLIDRLLNHYVYDSYNVLAGHLKYPFGTAIVLYISLLGVSITQGWVRLSSANFMKVVIKISLIYFLAMSWGDFSFYVVKAIEGSAGQIGYWLVSTSSFHLSHASGKNINNALQSVLTEVTKIGSWTWGQGSFHNLGPYFTAFFVWLFGCGVLALAVIEIIIAQMMLAILFALAPLFICFTLFKVTHGMFDRWLGAVCGFALFLVFIPAAVSLTLVLIQWTVKGYYDSHTMGLSLVAFIPLMIVSMLSVVLILKVTSYAQLIGGSFSTIGCSVLVSGVVGSSAVGALEPAVLDGGEFKPPSEKMADALVGRPVSQVFKGIRKRLRSGSQ